MLPADASACIKAKPSRGRVNVSHLRRENEILRVLEECGGIVNVQTKEFYDAHTTLLEVLAASGEPTSAPVGTRTDKRTALLTIEGLETKGKVKQLKTSIPTHTGVNKAANIVYLPSVSEEQLNAYLADLSRGPQPPIVSMGAAVKIEGPVEYGADPSVSSRGVLPLQLLQLELPGENKKERWSKNTARANQLFAYDDNTIRDVLLAERTTLGQLYGFIVGKAARARAFHLATLDLLESASSIPSVIPGQRIIDLSYFSNEIPVGEFTSYVSALSHSEQLTNFFSTEQGRRTPVKDLPAELHTQLQIGRSRARSRILDIFELLLSLRLVTPLRPSGSNTPWITCPPHGNQPTAFDAVTDRTWTANTPHAAPSHWYFNTEAPVFMWGATESEPSRTKVLSVLNRVAAKEFWQILKDIAIDTYFPHTIAPIQPFEQLGLEVSAARSLRRLVSWNADYVLTWHQQKYLEKSIDISTGRSALEEEDPEARERKLNRLCWVTSAPRRTVEEYLITARTRMLNDKDRLRAQTKETKRQKKLEDTKVALDRKAEEAKLNREKEWSSLLERVHPDDLGSASGRVERIHAKFLQAGSTRDMAKWEREVLDAIRETELASKKILKTTSKRTIVARSAGPIIAPREPIASASTVSLSIKALIDQQMPLLDQIAPKGKAGNKGKRKASDQGRVSILRSRSQVLMVIQMFLGKRNRFGDIDSSGIKTTTSLREMHLSSSERAVATRGWTGKRWNRSFRPFPATLFDSALPTSENHRAMNHTSAGLRRGGTACGSSTEARMSSLTRIQRVHHNSTLQGTSNSCD